MAHGTWHIRITTLRDSLERKISEMAPDAPRRASISLPLSHLLDHSFSAKNGNFPQ